LKDIVRNYADLVRSLRIILTAAQKAYVLDAPLGVPTPLVSSVDVVNVWQARSDDYSIVQCAMLYDLEIRAPKTF
jgi:hypothetical protein